MNIAPINGYKTINMNMQRAPVPFADVIDFPLALS